MSSLTTSLLTASSSMDAIEQAMAVIQNNVVNASTPGYVTQTLTLNARNFVPSQNIWGGVQAGALVSSRNTYAEENVWNQNTFLGAAAQQSSSLSALQNVVTVSAQTGIPSALSTLYAAFSAWSTTPTDINSQQQVLFCARGVVQAFNQASSNLQQLGQQTDGQLQSTVDQINQVTTQIAGFNAQIRMGSGSDGGIQAQLYNALETLSGLTNVQVRTESDGTVSVLMDGQIPLVLGTQEQQLSVSYPAPPNPPYPGAMANAEILSGNGTDVTALATGGRLGGLLQFRNTTLASVMGNPAQQGSLNQLAQQFADRVNQLLQSGQTANGSAGTPLFTYNAAAPASVAATLAVNSSLTASQLAAADPGPPPVANGVASHLAALSSPTSSADMINGLSYTDFYGNVATQIGTQAASASQSQSTQSDLLAQAQNLRAQVSGVSLNDQAALLMQFQQAYEAAAQMISVINTTTQYLMNSLARA